MFGLTQIIRNSFIRLEGFFSVFWNILANFVAKFFGFFGRLFGFSKSVYFVESNETQKIEKIPTQQPITTIQDRTPETTTATVSRLKNVKMDDYYLNMARDLKKK